MPNTVTCNATGGLNPTESLKALIEVRVNPSVPDGTTLSDTATASAATPDPVPANNSDTEDTNVQAQADLRIIKDGNFETGNPDSTIIYRLTVTNAGASDALSVVVTDTLPSDPKKLRFVFATEGCTYSEATHTVVCALGTMAAGASQSKDIHVQPKGNLGLITNTATVASSTADPNGGNNTATKDMLVQGGSDKTGPPPGRGKP